MKKATLITITFLIHISNSNAQEIRLGYIPQNMGNVSTEDYNYGKNRLEAAYEQIQDDVQGIYSMDYWNVAYSYAYMGVEDDTIFNLLVKVKSLDENLFCSMSQRAVHTYGLENYIFYKKLGEAFEELIKNCDVEFKRPTIESLNKQKENYDLTGLNESLIDRINALRVKDKKYRYSAKVYNQNTEKQHKLDEEVAIELTKIFDEYGYPGKDLVGEKYKNFGCLLLEHSGGKDVRKNLEFKNKYFPLVLEAYHNGDVAKLYVKMLIDRIHFFKEGKQVFGSHANIPFYDETTLKKLRKEYGI